MDLLCEEEISWSPCSPPFDIDSSSDHQSSSISSPDSSASNRSIHCCSISSFDSSHILRHSSSIYRYLHCSSSSSSNFHQPSFNCSINNSVRDPSLTSSPAAFWPPIEEHELDRLLQKELEYMPEKNYLFQLQLNELQLARSTALQWFIEAQCTFNFSSSTIALAINYFDRYLATNLSKAWTSWMLELLSTACLSTAAKMEEVFVPQLPDLQVGTRKHVFDTATVQRMELVLLSRIRWKTRAVTPFSFVELALASNFSISPHLQNILYYRISELLIAAALDASFQQFSSSILATTSIYCALEEVAPSQIDSFKSAQLARKILLTNEDEFWHCYKLMEAQVIDPLTPSVSQSPSNVASVIVEKDRQASPSSQNVEVIAGFLFEQLFTSNSTEGNSSYLCLCAFSTSKKRKREEEGQSI